MFEDFKTEIKLFFIVLIVAIILAVGAILLLKTMQPSLVQPKPTDQQTSPSAPSLQLQVIDTRSWQTYRNDEFGFEMGYPEEWIIEQSGPNYVQEQIDTGEIISGTVAPTLETISFFSPTWQSHPRMQFTLTISKTSKEVLFENYDNLSFSSSCDPRFLNAKPEIVRVVTNMQGVDFLEVKVMELEQYFSCYYSKSIDGSKVAFETALWGSSLDFEYAEKQIQEILSTFRFVE